MLERPAFEVGEDGVPGFDGVGGRESWRDGGGDLGGDVFDGFQDAELQARELDLFAAGLGEEPVGDVILVRP